MDSQVTPPPASLGDPGTGHAKGTQECNLAPTQSKEIAQVIGPQLHLSEVDNIVETQPAAKEVENLDKLLPAADATTIVGPEAAADADAEPQPSQDESDDDLLEESSSEFVTEQTPISGENSDQEAIVMYVPQPSSSQNMPLQESAGDFSEPVVSSTPGPSFPGVANESKPDVAIILMTNTPIVTSPTIAISEDSYTTSPEILDITVDSNRALEPSEEEELFEIIVAPSKLPSPPFRSPETEEIIQIPSPSSEAVENDWKLVGLLEPNANSIHRKQTIRFWLCIQLFYLDRMLQNGYWRLKKVLRMANSIHIFRTRRTRPW